MDKVEESIIEEWAQEQASLKSKLILEDKFTSTEAPKYIGGVDISFVKGTDKACASLVILNYTDMEVVYTAYKECLMDQPYRGVFSISRSTTFSQLAFLCDYK